MPAAAARSAAAISAAPLRATAPMRGETRWPRLRRGGVGPAVMRRRALTREMNLNGPDGIAAFSPLAAAMLPGLSAIAAFPLAMHYTGVPPIGSALLPAYAAARGDVSCRAAGR